MTMTVRIALGVLLACGGVNEQANQDATAILRSSGDRTQLENAAIQVVSSRNAKAIKELAALLGDAKFLGRLDDLTQPQSKYFHLSRVFAALERSPSPAGEALCLAVAADADFNAEPLRLNFLLPALAANRPMSEAAVTLFRRTNGTDYFGVNAPLLVANGSPRALGLFEEMIGNSSVDATTRVEALHASVLPHRNRLEVLQSVDRLLGRKLDSAVQYGLLESVFDYQPQRWFGLMRNPPVPPDWAMANVEARRFVMQLGRQQLQRKDLPETLLAALSATMKQLEKIQNN